MKQNCVAELEQLITGKTDMLEITAGQEMCRESVLDLLNSMLLSLFPGCLPHGEFINDDDSYLVYDLKVSIADSSSLIRFIDFGTTFKLMRIWN